ncbi:ATP-binding cassette domain-containing protein [Microvirga flavescens]|uniref:ATP-binding cassette domain-containing protein n=1 Tax=Microvirga flavescens TaxID=2249811 RepID=UPI0018E0B3F7|nr:ATP-binding cassette domain-containing protein [Microvirga flavescens]
MRRRTFGLLSLRASDARKLSEIRSASSFQFFNLFSHLTSIENIMLAIRVKNVPCDQAEARARELLQLVSPSDKADVMSGMLSGGQKQRIAIARTLAMDPSVILSDEVDQRRLRSRSGKYRLLGYSPSNGARRVSFVMSISPIFSASELPPTKT